MLPSIKDLTDSSLLDKVKCLKLVENKTIADLVLYLSEVDDRKLYREIGFSSLFTYCTSALSEGGLGYSEGAAYRRIQAARSLKNSPEIYELLREGKLSLCAVSEISRVITTENKAEILELSQGKPRTEVQRITANYQSPVMPLKREKIIAKKVVVANNDPLFSASDINKTTEETRFTFTLEVDSEFMELLEEAKNLIGVAPKSEILKRTLREFVARRKEKPRALKAVEPVKANTIGNNEKAEAKTVPAEAPDSAPRSRYIPKAVAYKVKERDEHQCSFIGPNGRRCTERCGLEIDHIKPFALGGSNEESNLRLLCPCHNQFLAEKVFGREKIESYFRCPD